MPARPSAVVLLLLVLAGCASTPPAPRAPALAGDAVLSTAVRLASPEFDGRRSGSPGYLAAAAYAAERFRAAGLEPAGDDGFFQRLAIEENHVTRCALSVEAGPGPAPAAQGPDRGRQSPAPTLQLGPDYFCRGFSGSGTVSAPVVFAGYGLSFPGLGYDDYAGLDVRGKVVLVVKDPPPFTLDDPGFRDATLPRPRALAAAAHGAAALLMVSAPSARTPAPIASVLHGPGRQPLDVPQLHVSAAVAERLFAGSGTSLEAALETIARGKRPASRALPATVRIDVRAAYEEAAPTVNVVGLLRGSDPAAADETLVVGAHLDHVGSQGSPGEPGGMVLLPGANDNASGSAVVLALADAFAAPAPRPRRSILFVLFAGEEQGLNGSTWYAEHPVRPLDRVVAMMNLDCVGHGGGRVSLGGGHSAPALRRLALRVAAAAKVRVDDRTWHGGGADAEAFFRKGIPTIYVHTEGSYTHLHLASDTAETLDPRLLEDVARLAFGVAREVADGGYAREPIAAPVAPPRGARD